MFYSFMEGTHHLLLYFHISIRAAGLTEIRSEGCEYLWDEQKVECKFVQNVDICLIQLEDFYLIKTNKNLFFKMIKIWLLSKMND